MDEPCSLTAHSDDARLTVALFASVVAAVLTALYVVARIGFKDNSITVALETVSLSFFLLFSPHICRSLLSFTGLKPDESWVTSDTAISLAAFLVLPIAGFAGQSVGVNALPAFAVLGFAFFAVSFFGWLRVGGSGRSLFFLFIALLFGLWTAGAVWGSGYQNPLYEEALVAGYYLCKDILVSASISSMLHTYGFPSTGLNGLIYCAHHWGVYWFFAGTAEVLRMDMIKFVQLGFPVIVIPFWISRLLVFTVEIQERIGNGTVAGALRKNYGFWLVFFTGMIGFLPTEAARKMALGGDLHFISVTYTAGLAWSFGVLSLAVSLSRRVGNQSENLTVPDHALICVIPILLFIVGLMKISLMFLLVAIYAYLFCRLSLWRYRTPLISLILTIVALVFAVRLTTNSGSGFAHIYPFGFFISNVAFAWKPFFLIFFYFWSWLFVVWRFYQTKMTTVGDLGEAWHEKKIVDAEVVAVTCLAGTAPAFLLAIPGGSGIYFMDFQNWFSLSLLLANIDAIRKEIIEHFAGLQKRHFSWGRVPLVYFLVFLLGLGWIGCLVTNSAQAVLRMVSSNMAIRCALAGINSRDSSCRRLEQSTISGRGGKAYRLAGNLLVKEWSPLFANAQQNLEKNPKYRMVQALKDLRDLPLNEKKKTLIFIPQSNRAYWGLMPACQAVPFIAPAVTGMALLEGLPSADCPVQSDTLINHYAVYRLRSREDKPLNLDRAGLCNMVRSKGFDRLITITVDANNAPTVSRLTCSQDLSYSGIGK
jgi:hypothetical protein